MNNSFIWDEMEQQVLTVVYIFLSSFHKDSFKLVWKILNNKMKSFTENLKSRLKGRKCFNDLDLINSEYFKVNSKQ